MDRDLDWILIIQTLYTMCGTIALVGGVILLTHSRDNRARRFHAYSMIFCCVIYFLRYSEMLSEDGDPKMVDVLNPWMQILGIFFAMLLSLYPLEVARPGWLNWKRALGLAAPYLLLLLFLCFIGYFVGIMWFIFRTERRYAQWLVKACPGGEEGVRNESWLRYYGYGMILILLGYLYLVLFGFHPLAQVYHNAVLQVFLFYTFYKISFFESPFLEEFFGGESAGPVAAVGDGDNSGTAVVNDPGVVDKWNLYKQEIERWFETERPYLNEDFRLNDVVDRFPLNRSYISRVFNEGYGKSFSIVVRDYRLRESERLLREEPGLTVAQVAERCGFASSSSFIRAFSGAHDGLTPKQYRDQLIAKS